MAPKLVKTSVQLPPDLKFEWPGLTQSEGIRLAVERGIYFSFSSQEKVVDVALKYAPILSPALEDLGYSDFKTIARALPAIVEAYIVENHDDDWRDPENRRLSLDWRELLELLKSLDKSERVYLLDCIVARRTWPSEPASILPTLEV